MDIISFITSTLVRDVFNFIHVIGNNYIYTESSNNNDNDINNGNDNINNDNNDNDKNININRKLDNQFENNEKSTKKNTENNFQKINKINENLNFLLDILQICVKIQNSLFNVLKCYGNPLG
jgi:hypothetical protein